MKMQIALPLLILFFCNLNSFASTAASDIKKEIHLWKRNGHSEIQIEFYRPSPHSFNLIFDLSLVLLRNSGWTTDIVIKHLVRVEKIYAQCSIGLRNIKIVTTNPPKGILDYPTIKGNEASSLALKTPIMAKPVLYFVRKIKEQTAAIAGAPFYVGNDSPVVNTAWFSSYLNEPSYSMIRGILENGQTQIFYRDPSYDVVAHELAHILGNLPHFEGNEQNLLSGVALLLNDYLTPEQCLKIKMSPLIKQL